VRPAAKLNQDQGNDEGSDPDQDLVPPDLPDPPAIPDPEYPWDTYEDWDPTYEDPDLPDISELPEMPEIPELPEMPEVGSPRSHPAAERLTARGPRPARDVIRPGATAP
jgi:hypothetical protein